MKYKIRLPLSLIWSLIGSFSGALYATVALAGPSLNQVGEIDVPSSCGSSYFKCSPKLNAQGKLDGVQECTNTFKNPPFLAYRATYKNGSLEGKVTCWKEAGVLDYEAEFKAGKYNGFERRGYEPSLRQWTTVTQYANNEKNGLEIGHSTQSKTEGGKSITTFEETYVRRFEKDKQHGYTVKLKDDLVTELAECYVNGEYVNEMEACSSISMGKYDVAIGVFQNKKNVAENKRCEGEQKRGLTEGYVEVYQVSKCKRNGLSTIFENEGKTKVVETLYKNEKRQGEQKVYFPEGQVSTLIVYNEDLPQSIRSFFQNGKPKSEVKISDAGNYRNRYDYKTFHENGKLAEEGSSIGGDRSRETRGSYPTVSDSFNQWNHVGCLKSFEKDGTQISSSCYNDQQKLDGLSWRKEKETKVEELYKQGTVVTRKVYNLASGKLLKTTELFPDGSVKSEAP